MTTTPVLKIDDPSKDFVVCTDASKEGLGGVLTQEDHVICYESQKLKEHEKKYVVHDMELAAIIHALKIWQHYLIGKKFLLLTDNIGLKYLFDKKHWIPVNQDGLLSWANIILKLNTLRGRKTQ